MKASFIAIMFIALAGCSTVDSVIDGSKGIVSGVASDVAAVTTGTLDVVSGSIKTVADKAGVEKQEEAK